MEVQAALPNRLPYPTVGGPDRQATKSHTESLIDWKTGDSLEHNVDPVAVASPVLLCHKFLWLYSTGIFGGFLGYMASTPWPSDRIRVCGVAS